MTNHSAFVTGLEQNIGAGIARNDCRGIHGHATSLEDITTRVATTAKDFGGISKPVHVHGRGGVVRPFGKSSL